MKVFVKDSHYNKLEFSIPSFTELSNFLMLITEYGVDIEEVQIINKKPELVLNEVEDDVS